MKKKHGVFFGFAVLVIAAIFALTGCETGNSPDNKPADDGNMELPGIAKGSVWTDEIGNTLKFGNTIVTATPKGKAATTYHFVDYEFGWRGKWYLMFDEEKYTLTVEWDGSALGGEDGEVFFGEGYSFSAHAWTGTNLGEAVPPPPPPSEVILPEVIQNTTWYDEENRRLQFETNTITTRGPNRTDETVTFTLVRQEFGANRGKWYLHFDDEGHDITVTEDGTTIDSEDGEFFFGEGYTFGDHTWGKSAQGGGGTRS